jgi:predicted secreted protein
MKKTSGLLLILCTLIFQCCSGQATISNPLCTSMKDELASGQIKLVVKQNTPFTIRLRSQAGTGYSWKMISHSPGLITTSQKETYENAPDSKPGAAGIQTFYFTAQKAGTETILFIYRQPFIKTVPENAPRKTVIVTINH